MYALAVKRREISRNELEVVRALIEHRNRWLSNNQIIELVPGPSPRTVRALTAKLVKAGVAVEADVFPGHRYKIAATDQCRAYLDRAVLVADALEVPLELRDKESA